MIEAFRNCNRSDLTVGSNQLLHEELSVAIERTRHCLNDFCDVAAERQHFIRTHSQILVQRFRQLRRSQHVVSPHAGVLEEDEGGPGGMQHIGVKYVTQFEEARTHGYVIRITDQSDIRDACARGVDGQLFGHCLNTIGLAQSGMPLRLGNTGLGVFPPGKNEKHVG